MLERPMLCMMQLCWQTGFMHCQIMQPSKRSTRPSRRIRTNACHGFKRLLCTAGPFKSQTRRYAYDLALINCDGHDVDMDSVHKDYMHGTTCKCANGWSLFLFWFLIGVPGQNDSLWCEAYAGLDATEDQYKHEYQSPSSGISRQSRRHWVC